MGAERKAAASVNKDINMANEKSGYYVWKLGGPIPTKLHECFDSAKEEAKRLAAKNPDSQFQILRVIMEVSYRTDPYVYKQFTKK